MTLDELIQSAKDHKMTKEERDQQRISFAYGNMSIHNPAITREIIEKEFRKIVK
jgi:hypothetical protein